MVRFENAQLDVGPGRPKLVVNIEIQDGQRVLFAGPNGSGKTSIFDAIIGFRRLSGGSITVEDQGPAAYVVQDALGGLLPWLTAEQNVLLPVKLTNYPGVDTVSVAVSLLKLFGLESLRDALPHKMSGGERQLINVIRAACTPSKLVLLDEPFTALHSQTKQLAIKHILPRFQGKTQLLISHDADDLNLEYDRYLILRGDHVEEATKQSVSAFLEKVA
jgi:ABC-type nitrate/sulfonate/bicarbonate transport system ATPase subunit